MITMINQINLPKLTAFAVCTSIIYSLDWKGDPSKQKFY